MGQVPQHGGRRGFDRRAPHLHPSIRGRLPLRPDRIEPPPHKNRIFFFAGGDIARDSHYAWGGIVGAPQGILQEDGPRFRIMAGTGRYTYRTGAAAGGINEGRITRAK